MEPGMMLRNGMRVKGWRLANRVSERQKRQELLFKSARMAREADHPVSRVLRLRLLTDGSYE